MHGRGVFAAVDLPEGEHLLVYGGEVVAWEVAQDRWERAGGDAGHTFFFDLGDGNVIDGGVDGNEARFVNHGCAPNCETVQDGDEIRIVTGRAIAAGEELFIDYRLTLDDDAAEEAREAYVCRCGAAECRGTMLID